MGARLPGPLGFVPDRFMDDPEADTAGLRAAFERLLELDFDLLLLGHGDPAVGDAKEQLGAFVQVQLLPGLTSMAVCSRCARPSGARTRPRSASG